MLRLLPVLFLLASQGVAMAANDQLKGLKTVRVFVVGLDEVSKRCGLTADAMKDSMMLPIRAYTKIREWKEGDVGVDGAIVLGVVSGNNQMLCAHAFSMSVETYGYAKLSFNDDLSAKRIVLWDTGAIVTSQVGHSKNSMSEIEEMARGFASAWQAANP